MRFIVKRNEMWEQEVVVEADSPEEARKKAAVEDGKIVSDPQFRRLLDMDDWEVIET